MSNQLSSLNGTEAVFRRHTLIACTKIDDVCPNSHGVHLELHCLDTPGLAGPDSDHMSLDSSWEDLRIDGEYVSDVKAGWRLYGDPGVVRQVRKLAERFINGTHPWVRFQAVSQYLDSYRGIKGLIREGRSLSQEFPAA